MFKYRITTLVVALVIAAPTVADDGDRSITVNCDEGSTVGQVLAEKARKGDPLVLRVRGTCQEHVTINLDDVTLEGDAGTIAGSVTIDGGRRAVIAHLTITNPTGDGVTVANGGSATIRNNHIDNSSGYGVFLRNASFAIVNHNTMINNGVINPTNVDASGIGVAQGSTVRALENEIRENANTGIEVFDNSTYRSEGDIVARRTSAPGRSAVDTYRAGYVDLRGVTVNGQVFVNQQSQLQVRNVAGFVPSTITGNISVSVLSFLRLRAGVVRSSSTLSCGVPSFSVCQCDDFPPFSVCPVSQ